MLKSKLLNNEDFLNILEELNNHKRMSKTTICNEIIMILNAYNEFRKKTIVDFPENSKNDLIQSLKLAQSRSLIREYSYQKLGGRKNKTNEMLDMLNKHIVFTKSWYQTIDFIEKNFAKRTIYRMLNKYINGEKSK